MIWINDLVVVSLIFGNLIYSVTFRKEEKKVKDEIRNAIQDFSKHQEEDAMKDSWHSIISDYSNVVVNGLTGQSWHPTASSHTNEKAKLSEINSAWKASHAGHATNTESATWRESGGAFSTVLQKTIPHPSKEGSPE